MQTVHDDYSDLESFATPRQLEYIDAIRTFGSVKNAASELDLNQRTISRGLEALQKNAATSGWAPAHDMTKISPSGFGVKGTSTLYDEDGNVKVQWVKTQREDAERVGDLLTVLDSYKLKSMPKIKAPTSTLDDLCTVYTLTDFHLAMYSWAEETGDDWDTDIAAKVLINAINDMVLRSPSGEMGVLNLQGDFLHWDGLEAVTPTSGHVLDADTRFERMIEMALDLTIWAVEALLKKHNTVKVIVCEGNHDLAGSAWLRKSIKKIFSKNERVDVDDTSIPFYAFLWGEIMLAFHHGHKVKNASLPKLFASEPMFRKMWGLAMYCYINTGHYHHQEQDVIEDAGAVVERHPTLAGRDAYAARGGYVSKRGAKAVTYHKEHGEIERITVVPRLD